MKRQNRSRYQQSRRPSNRSKRHPLNGLFASLDIAGMLFRIAIGVMLADIAQNMVRALRDIIPADQETQPIDEDYATRFAAALYYSCVTFPYAALIQMGGPINVAWNMMHDMADKCSPAAVLALFKEGFVELSPTMANALTEDILVKTGKLMFWDWLNNSEPKNENDFRRDIHIYFHELVDMEAPHDDEVVLREAYTHIMQMTPDELEHFDPELIEIAREWGKRQNGV